MAHTEYSAKFAVDRTWQDEYVKALRAPSGRRPAKRSIHMVDHLEAIQYFLELLPYGCLIVDTQGVICAANPAALELLALPSDQLLQRPLFDAIPAWKQTPLAEILAQTGSTSSPQDDEPFELDLPANGERALHVHLVTMPTATRALFLTDASEMVRLKQRLRWTEYQASIGKLARGIAHELNNPLDGVLRYTRLALDQLTEDSPVREYLTHVQEGLDRMVRAVRAFLEFSRQALAPVNRIAHLNQLIDDALLLVKHRAKFQSIRIVKEFQEPLPAILDAGIQHAIVNLVKNAIDAMPRGGTLTITTRANGGGVEVLVQDTGAGIPEDIHTRIFEPFFSTKPIHQGSGLGLVIAKEVVERSGGTIEFASQVGIGTTFTMRIPAAPPEGLLHGS